MKTICRTGTILLMLALVHLWGGNTQSLAFSSSQALVSDLTKYTVIRKDGTSLIHLPAGIYDVTESLLLPSNTILEGEDVNTILRVLVPFSGSRFITNRDSRRGNTNITVRSLKIEFLLPKLRGDAPGILRFEHVDFLHLQNITMEIKSELYGVDLSSSVRHAIIEGCTIRNTGGGGGIMVRNRDGNTARSSHDIIIRNNRLTSTIGDEPLAVFGWMGTARKIQVHHNEVFSNGASFGITAYGIDSPLHGGTLAEMSIRQNIVRGGKIGSIAVKGGARDVEVVQNSVSDATGDGIFLHAGGDNLPYPKKITVKDNSIVNIGRHCVFATGSDILIEGNRISDCKESGIYVGNNTSVIGNIIINAKPGILVEGDTSRVVRGNILRKASRVNVLNNDYTGISDNIIQ